MTPFEGVGLDSIKKGSKIFMDKAFLSPLSYILSADAPKSKISKDNNRPSG